jgi:hypothetical protein
LLLVDFLIEEQRGHINNVGEIAIRKKKREEMKIRLATIEREIDLIGQRLKRLPALPDLTCIRWAQSVRSFPNGRILTIDTAFSAENATIVRIHLLDFDGGVSFDSFAAPSGSANNWIAMKGGEMVS